MTLPDWLRAVLLPDTAATWETIAEIVPAPAYLAGGTAISVHLHHRVSRDLDFFYHHDAIDLDALTETLRARGPFAVTLRSPGMLNGVFSDTRLQFLHADGGPTPQRLLEEPTLVHGVRIAGISDLFAMKLKVIGDRGEARDYFDLMTIEQQTGRRAEEGLGLYLARYNVPGDEALASITPIVRGLGYFGDVEEDEALPVPLAEIEAYWQQRQPEIIAHIDRFGAVTPPEGALSLTADSGGPSAQGPVHVQSYRRADGTQVRDHNRGR